MLAFPQLKRTQRRIPMNNPFTEYINSIRNNSTVTNQSKYPMTKHSC